MKKLIQFLWSGCFHQWETDSITNLVDGKGGVVGFRYILRCKKCGEVVKRDLYSGDWSA